MYSDGGGGLVFALRFVFAFILYFLRIQMSIKIDSVKYKLCSTSDSFKDILDMLYM
jgi:hypothetical protein